MAASWELQLVSAIVRGEEPARQFEAAQKAGIRAEFFGTAEGRLLWSRIDAHYNRGDNFGHVPSEEQIAEWFPAYDLPTPVENFPDLCTNVRNGYLRRKAETLIEEFEHGVREDAAKALVALSTEITTLQTECLIDTDADFKQTAVKEVADHLVRAKESGGVLGLPWPWTYLNEATMGIRPKCFYLAWALPKSMKTYWGLVIAAYLFQQGQRVLVYSKEMTWEEVRDRIAAIIARVDIDRYLKGRLTDTEQEHLLLTIERVSDPTSTGQLFFTQADRLDGGKGGPAEIRKKVLQYKPVFVLLDSSYMLEMPGAQGSALDWRNLAALTRELKQVCLSTGASMLAIMQENERAAIKYKGTRGTASMAYNTSAPADCDGGFHLVLNKKAQELSVHIAVLRTGKGDGFTIHAQPCENFEFAGTHLWHVGDDDDTGTPPVPLVDPAAASKVTKQVGNSISRFRARLNSPDGQRAPIGDEDEQE